MTVEMTTVDTDTTSARRTPTSGQGWHARLALTYGYRRQKTRLIHSQRLGPLSVQRAFYPEGEVCHSYLLHPPGGVVGGDSLDIHIEVQPQAHALITTPGATKFYRSQGKPAFVQQHLFVAEQATLEWFPHENIYFPGSSVNMNTQIHLTAQSRFIGWDIQCLGRPVIQERFEASHGYSGMIKARLQLTIDQQPLLIEHFKTNNEQLQLSPSGLRGFPMQATLLMTPGDNTLLERIQTLVEGYEDASILMAATRLESVLVIRLLGHQTQPLLAAMKRLWIELRPLIVQKTPCEPRIWLT